LHGAQSTISRQRLKPLSQTNKDRERYKERSQSNVLREETIMPGNFTPLFAQDGQRTKNNGRGHQQQNKLKQCSTSLDKLVCSTLRLIPLRAKNKKMRYKVNVNTHTRNKVSTLPVACLTPHKRSANNRKSVRRDNSKLHRRHKNTVLFFSLLCAMKEAASAVSPNKSSVSELNQG